MTEEPERTSPGQPLVTYQTGENESFLIGTREQLRALAESIIEAINSPEAATFYGHRVLVSRALCNSFDSKAGFGIDAVVVVQSDDQKNDVFYSVYNS